ncbi:hypothetical protein CTAYLR_003531 [Chrysophaeum taylorii]|uniref:Uncharacterized protein n=1 Tax=Chrysophaeum taylorii TaxID=2483200 RepID=A0AAD7UDU6_9STRA|nr:hypothetical protein CTAYLR_003531 [Chrysophaeum taylorii]
MRRRSRRRRRRQVVVVVFILGVVVGAQDVTLVSHGSVEKLWLVGPVCERWRGPLSLAVWGFSLQEFDASRCSSFALKLLQPTTPEYPVNTLRNLAVQQVNTSHHLVSDLDFLPSSGLRLYLKTIDKASNAALVVPAFQRRGGNCKSLETCRERVEPLVERVPATFDSLLECLAEKKCQEFQRDSSPGSHSTTDLVAWLTQTTLRPIPCFRTNRYEPYVVVPAATSPPYDERFSGYGKNKIQHVTHLRKLGFQFSVLPHHFLIHLPHPKSRDKQHWMSDYDRHLYVDRLYDSFLRDLDARDDLPTLGPPIAICGHSSRRKKTKNRREDEVAVRRRDN